MSRHGKKPKDPAEYVKWKDMMIKDHGRAVFASLDVNLPDEFEVLKDSEKDAVNNDVSEKLRLLGIEHMGENEDFITDNGLESFVSEDDWGALNADTPMTSGLHHFKIFSGKNYSLEFVRQDSEIFFHLYYPASTITARDDVFEKFEEIMTPIIPRHWRVSMCLDTKVMPHTQKRSSNRAGDYQTSSSYSIHFVKGAEMDSALHYINNALKAFLKTFIMPTHQTGT